MKSVRVAYFDGRVSTRREVLLVLDGNRVIIRGPDGDLSYPVSSLALPSGVGSIRRTIRLPDGGVCELDDAGLMAELERLRGGAGGGRLLHVWEKNLPLVLGALTLTVLVALVFTIYGVPFLARRAAFALPPATEKALGRESLATLDRVFMKPSRLSRERRDELTALFRRVAGPEGIRAGYRLEFRSSPAIGANAFALPSGVVVVTDELVGLAGEDDEIAAIMAHELGHARGRHIMRHVLQSSAAGLIMATLTGDITSLTSLSATLPTVLVDASFSRDFEREADDAAIAWMKSTGVPLRVYAGILGRLQARMDARHGGANGNGRPSRNYLSTHPETWERIRRIMSEDKEKVRP